jgi:NADH:ubiquinone oxidoreductase subunit
MAWRAVRSVVSGIMKNPNKRKVGEDLNGNVFFIQVTPDAFPPEKRLVELRDSDADIAQLPVQWQSWLNGRRQDPPSLEELRNHQKSMLVLKQKVMELQEEEEKTRLQELAASKAAQQQKASAPHPPSSSSSSPSSSFPSFPKRPTQLPPTSPSSTATESRSPDEPTYSGWQPKS